MDENQKKSLEHQQHTEPYRPNQNGLFERFQEPTTSGENESLVKPGTDKILEIEISSIDLDTTLQCRVQTTTEVVNEYAIALERGDEFPAIHLVKDPLAKSLRLVDGFHRVLAYQKIGCKTIWARISIADQIEAVKIAAAANSTHGLRRTNADKRNSVKKILLLPECTVWSDRAIAELCKVDHKSVSAVRNELVILGKIQPVEKSINRLGQPQLGSRRKSSNATSENKSTAGEIPRPKLESNPLHDDSITQLVGKIVVQITNHQDEKSSLGKQVLEIDDNSAAKQHGSIAQLRAYRPSPMLIELLWIDRSFQVRISSPNHPTQSSLYTLNGPDPDQEFSDAIRQATTLDIRYDK